MTQLKLLWTYLGTIRYTAWKRTHSIFNNNVHYIWSFWYSHFIFCMWQMMHLPSRNNFKWLHFYKTIYFPWKDSWEATVHLKYWFYGSQISIQWLKTPNNKTSTYLIEISPISQVPHLFPFYLSFQYFHNVHTVFIGVYWYVWTTIRCVLRYMVGNTIQERYGLV